LNSFLTISALLYLFFGVIIIIGTKKQIKREKINRASSVNKINLTDLTVIIPFRNEIDNLPILIQSIQDQTKLPVEFIFVNDHSIDHGEFELKKLGTSINHTLLNLPIGQQGKKAAIRFGIQASKTDFILTLDADVSFNSSYFSELEQLNQQDMLILPVIMKGKKSFEKFYEYDYAISNAINTSISGLNRPFLASGANLLFKKESFLKFDSIELHKNISSGDDIFLLRDFQKNDCEVELISSISNAVYTKTPNSISSFIQQRVRWVTKGRKVNDSLGNGLGFIAFLTNLIFTAFFIHFIQNSQWMAIFLLVSFKGDLEMLVYLPYFKNIQRMKTWIITPLVSFIYPFYIVILIAVGIFTLPKWKERTINDKA
jgi:glycosyltransferase involved in cell wall biosynthesis